MTDQWPADWDALTRGEGCGMCRPERPDEDQWGVRIHATATADAMLQRENLQRGYTVVIWRGRHVTEPYELSATEAADYWAEVLKVGAALAAHYQPLKMNYATLGNSLPHLHTHLIPRYHEDPAPGRPFPMDPTGESVPEEQLRQDVAQLRTLLA